MTKNRIALMLAIMFLAVFFVAGCYKGTTLDLSSDLEITRDVSFATDVIPLLEKNCSLNGCHSSGAISPDLSSGNAYNSLTNGGFVDIENPKSSRIYGLVSGTLTPVMPVSGADPEIAAIILAWINQGAQNN